MEPRGCHISYALLALWRDDLAGLSSVSGGSFVGGALCFTGTTREMSQRCGFQDANRLAHVQRLNGSHDLPLPAAFRFAETCAFRQRPQATTNHRLEAAQHASELLEQRIYHSRIRPPKPPETLQ